jgi:hypothetical protein
MNCQMAFATSFSGRRVRDVIGETYYKEDTLRDAGEILYEILRPEAGFKLEMITNWRRNRPPDIHRVEEIAKDIEMRGSCDGELLLAIIPAVGCVCYDGIHRLEAARRVFPHNGLRLRILLNSSEKEVEQEFKRINKGVPVPELYFSQEETDAYLREQVQQFIDKYFIVDSRLLAHISTSKHPKRPNFNKDVLHQTIGEYVDEYFTAENGFCRADIHDIITAEVIMSWFNDMNEVARGIIESSQKNDSMIEKCKKTGWFLFYFDWRGTIAPKVKLFIRG